MPQPFAEKLQQAETLADVFELVKEAVRKTHGFGRAGLNLGLAELGGEEHQLLGAFYPVGGNIIVMNKTPLRKISETKPELYKPYAFHILLHEYLHSLGYLDERLVRAKAYQISARLFGEEHLATQMALDLRKFLPDLIYDPHEQQIDVEQLYVELVKDFDRSSLGYIM